MKVRDPALAQRAAQIARSPQIPPQTEDIRPRLVPQLLADHPQLASMPAQIARSIGTARVRRGEKALLAREAGK
jgi:hypothetical protein